MANQSGIWISGKPWTEKEGGQEGWVVRLEAPINGKQSVASPRRWCRLQCMRLVQHLESHSRVWTVPENLEPEPWLLWWKKTTWISGFLFMEAWRVLKRKVCILSALVLCLRQFRLSPQTPNLRAAQTFLPFFQLTLKGPFLTRNLWLWNYLGEPKSGGCLKFALLYPPGHACVDFPKDHTASAMHSPHILFEVLFACQNWKSQLTSLEIIGQSPYSTILYPVPPHSWAL